MKNYILNMITKKFNRKTALIGCQLLTVVGILVGLCAGGALLWEITDVYMYVGGKLYTLAPESQVTALQEVVNELTDDGIEYGLTAAFSLVVALLAAISATVLACFSKSATHA